MASTSQCSARPITGALLVAAGASTAWLVFKRLRTAPRNVTWVPGWPLFGSVVQLMCAVKSCTIHDLLDDWREKYGSTFGFWDPGRRVVLTCNPANIEHILKTRFEIYAKEKDRFEEVLGDGIFNVDGALWHAERKTMSRLFSKKNFEGHFFDASMKYTKQLMCMLGKCKAEVDIFSLLNRFTLDTIADIGFGQCVGALQDDGCAFARAFDRCQQLMFMRSFLHPVWKVIRWLGLGWEGELRRELKVLNSNLDQMVEDLKSRVKRGETDHSFLNLFMTDSKAAVLAAKLRGCSEDKFYRDMVKSFLIAGRDTTAQCLAWTLFELAQHPRVVDRARAEIESVCGSGDVTLPQLGQLRYVQAVLDEGLRLHPSVPIDMKIPTEDDIWPDGTIIPKGTEVIYFMYGQGRSKELWGEDARAFRPERWLEMKSKPSSFVFTAFNGGPRECLGRRLAEMEMRLFLSTFLRDFDFRLAVDPKEVRYDIQLTLSMNGLPLFVQRRALPTALAQAGA